MIKAIQTNTRLKTALVFLLLFVIPIALGTVLGYQTIGGYLSPLLLFLITWLLYRGENKTLDELGLIPRKKNWLFLPGGIILGTAVVFISLLVQMINVKVNFTLNPKADYLQIAGGLFLLLAGVLNEELIFRGYCFKKTVDKNGILIANIIFAFLFMVWHWISWNAWGNWPVMLGSITTAIGHILFATAFLSSRTLFFAIGIHWGINWAQHNIFSFYSSGNIQNNSPAGTLILLDSPDQQISQFQEVMNNVLPALIVLGIAWLIWMYRKRSTA